MGLMERDYMKETYEDRMKARIERIEKEKRKEELWSLYGKKHKTIFDKMRIKEIEQINLHGDKHLSRMPKNISYITMIKSILIVLIIILILYIAFQLYELFFFITF